MCETNPILKRVPLEARILENVVTQRQWNFAQEVIPSKQITMPYSEPQVASLYFSDRQSEFQNLIKNWIQGVFSNFGLSFSRFATIW